jgi:hypothetical protein
MCNPLIVCNTLIATMAQQPTDLILTEWNLFTTTLIDAIDTFVYPMFTIYVENYGHEDFVHNLRTFERDMHELHSMCIPLFNDLYHREYGYQPRFHPRFLPLLMHNRGEFMATVQDLGLEPTLLTAVSQLRRCLIDPDIRNTLGKIQYLILVTGACLTFTDEFRAMRGLPR